MQNMNDRALEILRELGDCPSVPFFETSVSTYVLGKLQEFGVESYQDIYGNILAHHKTSKRVATSEPPIAFIAHMDHPGFEIVAASEEKVVARALGGVPMASLKKPTPVMVLLKDGEHVPAEIVPYDIPEAQDNTDRLVLVRMKYKRQFIPPIPIVFDLPGYSLAGDRIEMRALDDLAGCASILSALERIISEDTEVDVFAIFTRCEEEGLYGARLMAEAETLSKETLIISVESSPIIAGVKQGDGPIIRTGDASYTFNAEAEDVLVAARESLRRRNPEFKCQRQLMSGGTCEATAFAVFGYKTTGIAFALGNYHNATSRLSDPDGGIGAEYIQTADYFSGIELITEAALSVPLRNDFPARMRMRQIPEVPRLRLKRSAAL